MRSDVHPFVLISRMEGRAVIHPAVKCAIRRQCPFESAAEIHLDHALVGLHLFQ